MQFKVIIHLKNGPVEGNYRASSGIEAVRQLRQLLPDAGLIIAERK